MKRQVARLVFMIGAVAIFVAPANGYAQVSISGNGSGAFQPTAVAGGSVGWAVCVVDRSVSQITCDTRVYNIVDLTAAHLHLGGPGANGPVAIAIPDLPLHISGAFSQSFILSGADLISRPAQGVRNFNELADACASGNCYLNYHTTNNPGGEMRIQLCPKSALSNFYTGVAVCTNP